VSRAHRKPRKGAALCAFRCKPRRFVGLAAIAAPVSRHEDFRHQAASRKRFLMHTFAARSKPLTLPSAMAVSTCLRRCAGLRRLIDEDRYPLPSADLKLD
jgi:hypothetical protein